MNDDTFSAHRPGDLDDLSLLPRRFDNLASRVDEMSDQGNRILQMLGKMSEAIDDIRHHQSSMGSEIGAIAKRLDTVAGDVRETRAQLDRRVVELEKRVAKLESQSARKRTVRRRRATRARATRKKARR